MDFYSLSDDGVAEELGVRIKALRLRKNITQDKLAGAVMLSLNSIKSLESGRGKLSTLIAVLRELGVLEQLDSFIPEATVSPLQLAKMKGKQRARASGKRQQSQTMSDKPEGEAEW